MDQADREYIHQVKRFVNYCLYSLVLILIGLFLSPYGTLFAGLLLGTLIGIVNWIHIAVKVYQVGQAAYKGSKPPNLGLLTRLSMAALGAIIVVAFPGYFHLLGLAIGLILPSVFIIIDGIYLHLKAQAMNRKG